MEQLAFTANIHPILASDVKAELGALPLTGTLFADYRWPRIITVLLATTE